MPGRQDQIMERTEIMIRAGGWCSGEELWTHFCLLSIGGLSGAAGAYFALSMLKNSSEENHEINRDADAKAYAFFCAQFAALGAAVGKIAAKKSWQFFQWMGNKLSTNNQQNDVEMQSLLPNPQQKFRDLGIHMEDETVPRQFICLIGKDFFRDPVTTSNGETYERSYIEAWLQHNQIDPITGEPLPNKTLVPNNLIVRMMLEFAEKRQTDSAEHQLIN